MVKILSFPPFFCRLIKNILGKQRYIRKFPRPDHRERTFSRKLMVALRLNRQGTKDRPYYKIVAVDNRKRRDGRYIEQLGTYNPMQEGENYTLDLEKADAWISKGAQPSVTVASIIKKVRNAK